MIARRCYGDTLGDSNPTQVVHYRGTLVNWVTVTGHKEDYKIKILFRDEE